MKCTKNGCLQCYNSKPVANKSTSAKYLEQSRSISQCVEQPPLDSCMVYSMGDNPGEVFCTACKPGYTYNTETRRCDDQPKIVNCLTAFTIGGTTTCSVCINSYPSIDQTKCLPYPTPATGKFAFCLHSSLNPTTKKPDCARCSDGYVSHFGYCVSATEEFKACMIVKPDSGLMSCIGCNVFEGCYDVSEYSTFCRKV